MLKKIKAWLRKVLREFLFDENDLDFVARRTMQMIEDKYASYTAKSIETSISGFADAMHKVTREKAVLLKIQPHPSKHNKICVMFGKKRAGTDDLHPIDPREQDPWRRELLLDLPPHVKTDQEIVDWVNTLEESWV